ncbi:MAG TPA: SIR2 family protein [Steroidobacteraceae bacterium]
MKASRWDRRPPFPVAAHQIPNATVNDPAVDAPQLLRSFNLIKLHGSINWRTADGAQSMVMGGRKALTISRSPLLGWYSRVFESVLSSGDIRLMVIGYGWGDDHINQTIADAVRDHGLQIYSWNPAIPRDMLNGKPRASDILPGIMGYTQRSMRDVMPPSPMNPGSAFYDAIVQDFF